MLSEGVRVGWNDIKCDLKQADDTFNSAAEAIGLNPQTVKAVVAVVAVSWSARSSSLAAPRSPPGKPQPRHQRTHGTRRVRGDREHR